MKCERQKTLRGNFKTAVEGLETETEMKEKTLVNPDVKEMVGEMAASR